MSEIYVKPGLNSSSKCLPKDVIFKLLVTDIFIILHIYCIFVYYGHIAYTVPVVSVLLTNLNL